MTTSETSKRILSAIADTVNLLDMQMSYPEDLRDSDKVSFYTSHIDKLKKMLRETK